jgi:hypothetical protein
VHVEELADALLADADPFADLLEHELLDQS